MKNFVFKCSKNAERERAEMRGHVAGLMAASPAYKGYPMACLTAWIDTAIDLRQIKVFFDPQTERPVGYVTWAWLTPDVEHRWLYDPKVLFHFSEWNEGKRLWIMDFVAPFGHCQKMVAYLREHLLEAETVATSVRRKADGSLRTIRRWHRNARLDEAATRRKQTIPTPTFKTTILSQAFKGEGCILRRNYHE